MLNEVEPVDMDVASTEAMIAGSVCLRTRWPAPRTPPRGFERIINFASRLGIKGVDGLNHYSAAKTGVIGFTKALARQLAPRGVLVNAIGAAAISTSPSPRPNTGEVMP